jgi:phage head maturation protease
MFGRFCTYDVWTEINSRAEGHFLERFAQGSLTQTLTDPGIRALFQHGFDPQIGDKPLGAVRSLDEQGDGVHFEVDLIDASYVRDVAAGLRAGLYGSSFRFGTQREDRVRSPGKSEHNPQGLPEVTVREAVVREFGPVTFPQYKESTAGMRSVTDELYTLTHPSEPRTDERAEPKAVKRSQVSLHLPKRATNRKPNWYIG